VNHSADPLRDASAQLRLISMSIAVLLVDAAGALAGMLIAPSAQIARLPDTARMLRRVSIASLEPGVVLLQI
jgi:hypothetical protein